LEHARQPVKGVGQSPVELIGDGRAPGFLGSEQKQNETLNCFERSRQPGAGVGINPQD